MTPRVEGYWKGQIKKKDREARELNGSIHWSVARQSEEKEKREKDLSSETGPLVQSSEGGRCLKADLGSSIVSNLRVREKDQGKKLILM